MNRVISIRGAREHYLKNVDLDLPTGRLIVITGVSGSGKSSLAVDVLYTEGRRRLLEFLADDLRGKTGDIGRPDVDSIEGLCPVVLVEGNSGSMSERSTVGTLTDIQDYLRVLYSRCANAACHLCSRPLRRFETGEIVQEMLSKAQDRHVVVLAPLPGGASLSWLRKEGFVRIRSGRELLDLDRISSLEVENMQLVVDRLQVDATTRSRLAESVELALRYGGGSVRFSVEGLSEDLDYATDIRCLNCSTRYGLMPPGFFSFNNPQGACPACHGLGNSRGGRTCNHCAGMRLRPEALSVRLGEKSIHAAGELPLAGLAAFLSRLEFERPHQRAAAGVLLDEMLKRIRILNEFGLGYLHLNRTAASLSGGELQRVRLASQMACALAGVLYILDEPTLGLHACEVEMLIGMLRRLKDMGNTVLVIEHDAPVMRAADWIVEMGPGAGSEGGRVVCEGEPERIMAKEDSLTAGVLRGRMLALTKDTVRRSPRDFIEIRHARLHNLNDVSVKIPLGCLCCVTGVSGSGKSTLVFDILCGAVASGLLGKRGRFAHALGSVTGIGKIDRLVRMESGPSRQTARSNVATLLEIFSDIRELFSRVPESRVRGYTPARFSFNTPGGRCEACGGLGMREVKMALLSDFEVACDICLGRRYEQETLEVRLKGKNIAEVLDMTLDQALEFFKNVSRVRSRISSAVEIGLGYLRMGQTSRSLSSGEIQRIKLALELGTWPRAHALYVFDEPTRGLHMADIRRLLTILDGLCDRGHSVLMIEHHLDVIRASDYCIDMGPGAGEDGGRIIAQGTPEDLIRCKASVTGRYLISS